MIAIYTDGPFRGFHFNPDQETLDVEWNELSTILRAHCMAFIAQTYKKSPVYAAKGVTVYQDANGFELSVETMLDYWVRSWQWEYPLDEPENPKMLYPFSSSDIPSLCPVPEYQKNIDLTELIQELDDPKWEDFNDDDRNTMAFDDDLDDDDDNPLAANNLQGAKALIGIPTTDIKIVGKKPNLAQAMIELGKRFGMARSAK